MIVIFTRFYHTLIFWTYFSNNDNQYKTSRISIQAEDDFYHKDRWTDRYEESDIRTIVLDKLPLMLPSIVKVQRVFIMCYLLESHHILANVSRFLLFAFPSMTVQNKTRRTDYNFEFLITGVSII